LVRAETLYRFNEFRCFICGIWTSAFYNGFLGGNIRHAAVGLKGLTDHTQRGAGVGYVVHY